MNKPDFDRVNDFYMRKIKKESVKSLLKNGVVEWRAPDERLHRTDGPAIIWPDGIHKENKMAYTCVLWCDQTKLDYMLMPGNIAKYNKIFADDPLRDEDEIFDMLAHFNNAPTCSIYQFAKAIPKACAVITCGLSDKLLRKPT
jgi:hypothetical protein